MRPLLLGHHAIGSTRLARTLEARHALIARALPGAHLLQAQGDATYDRRGSGPRPYIPSPQTIRDAAREVARVQPAAPVAGSLRVPGARSPTAPRWACPSELPEWRAASAPVPRG